MDDHPEALVLLPVLLLLACGDKDPGLDGTADGGAETGTAGVDADGDGYESDVDCDDTDDTVHPNAPEVCNGVDDDCDDLVDDEDTLQSGAGDFFYTDADGDGFGEDGSLVQACQLPADAAEEAGDCDDGDPAVHPDAQEVCNGVDDDCDDLVDDEDSSLDLETRSSFHYDGDGDGYGTEGVVGVACAAAVSTWVEQDGDCDDDDPAVNPGAPETCNGQDDDCDDLVDQDDDGLDPETTPTVYVDLDGDGFGDEASARQVCEIPEGVIEVGGDCDDGDPAVHPEASEVCNGLDDDCDALLDDEDDSLDEGTRSSWWVDADGDGYGLQDSAERVSCDPGDGWAAVEGDCDDADDAIHPGAAEICNGGVDDDCDRLEDDEDDSLDPDSATAWYPDEDEDGYGDDAAEPDLTCTDPGGDTVDLAGDCDDGDAAVSPDATEVCNGIDDDCDGALPSTEEDDRGDGWPDCMGAAVEVGGDRSAERSEGAFWLGNLLQTDEDATLRSYRTWLSLVDECEVHFYVASYPELASGVSPTLEWSATATYEDTEGWIETGDIDLDLEADTVYYLMVGWLCPDGAGHFAVDEDEAWMGADALVGTLQGWATRSPYEGPYDGDLPELSAFAGAVEQIIFVE